MLGAIIGDIAGSKYEFNNVRTEDFEFMGPGCDYTDDTVCTVAVADAAMSDQDYAAHLQKWCRADNGNDNQDSNSTNHGYLDQRANKDKYFH